MAAPSSSTAPPAAPRQSAAPAAWSPPARFAAPAAWPEPPPALWREVQRYLAAATPAAGSSSTGPQLRRISDRPALAPVRPEATLGGRVTARLTAPALGLEAGERPSVAPGQGFNSGPHPVLARPPCSRARRAGRRARSRARLAHASARHLAGAGVGALRPASRSPPRRGRQRRASHAGARPAAPSRGDTAPPVGPSRVVASQAPYLPPEPPYLPPEAASMAPASAPAAPLAPAEAGPSWPTMRPPTPPCARRTRNQGPPRRIRRYRRGRALHRRRRLGPPPSRPRCAPRTSPRACRRSRRGAPGRPPYPQALRPPGPSRPRHRFRLRPLRRRPV